MERKLALSEHRRVEGFFTNYPVLTFGIFFVTHTSIDRFFVNSISCSVNEVKRSSHRRTQALDENHFISVFSDYQERESHEF